MSVKEEKIYSYIDDNKINIEKIMNNYNNYIKTIIKKSNITFSIEDEEEILLDVYLTIWNNQYKLNISKNISPYIAGVTKILMLKKVGKLKKEYNIDEYEEKIIDSINIELEYEKIEKKKKAIEVIKKMKEEDRKIFIYYYYKQQKVKEIATILNVSEGKVKTKLFRMRKKIKKILEEEKM